MCCPAPDREVRRLDHRAREGGWGKRKLQVEADRVVARLAKGEQNVKPQRDPLASIRSWLSKMDDLSVSDRDELCDLLRGALDRLSESACEGLQRRAAKAGE